MPVLKTAVWLGVWWIALAAGLVLGLGALNLPRLYRIATHPVLAEAVVFSTDCSNHALVHYRYTAANQLYFGRSHLGQECSRLGPGDRIHVYLSEADPSLSEAGSPRAALINELTTVALAALFAPSFIITLTYFRYRRSMRRGNVTGVAQVARHAWTVIGNNRLPAAATAGVFIQALLMLMGAQFQDGVWQALMAPGMLAAMLIWGPHGPVSDGPAFIAIIIGINIIVYSLIALVVLRLINHVRTKLST